MYTLFIVFETGHNIKLAAFDSLSAATAAADFHAHFQRRGLECYSYEVVYKTDVVYSTGEKFQ